MLQKKYIYGFLLIVGVLGYVEVGFSKRSYVAGYLENEEDQSKFEKMKDHQRKSYLDQTVFELYQVKDVSALEGNVLLFETLKYLASKINSGESEFAEYYNYLLKDLEKSKAPAKNRLAQDIRNHQDMGLSKIPVAPAAPSLAASAGSVSKDDLEEALEALEDLADGIEFTGGAEIKSQADWKKFCEAFAVLVRDGNWDEHGSYTWNGANLTKK